MGTKYMIYVTHFALKNLTDMREMHAILVQFPHLGGFFDSRDVQQNLIPWVTAWRPPAATRIGRPARMSDSDRPPVLTESSLRESAMQGRTGWPQVGLSRTAENTRCARH